MSVAPLTIDLVPGGTATAAVTVERGGSFTAGITLVAHRLAPGMAVAFEPNPVPPGFTASIVVVTSVPLVPVDTLPAMRGTPAGGSRIPPPDIAFIRMRHTIRIEAVGDAGSASALLNVLCESTCEP